MHLACLLIQKNERPFLRGPTGCIANEFIHYGREAGAQGLAPSRIEGLRRYPCPHTSGPESLSNTVVSNPFRTRQWAKQRLLNTRR